MTIVRIGTPALTVPGEVLVATHVDQPGHRQVGCPAAPLLAGELARRGLRTTSGPLTVRPAQPDVGTGYALPGPAPASWAMAVAAARPDLPVALRAVAAWARCRRPRTVILAAPRSFCAGVERAIEVVERVLALRGAPVYVRKQIVHNTHVVRDLAERGAVFVEELDGVPDGAVVVFSAHGVSPAVRAEADRRGLEVIDATCPLVTKVHAEARRFAARGDTVVLIGHLGHEEVEGTVGEAPEATVVIESAADVADLNVPDQQRVSYLTQTTVAVDETTDAIAALTARFPHARGPGSDDICYATTNRQHAVAAVAAEADVVLVLGSPNSSNSVRLVELVNRSGTPAHLIDDTTHIRPDWIAAASAIGVTAGASAPPTLVDDMITALSGLGPVAVTERRVALENVHFAVPRTVRKHQ